MTATVASIAILAPSAPAQVGGAGFDDIQVAPVQVPVPPGDIRRRVPIGPGGMPSQLPLDIPWEPSRLSAVIPDPAVAALVADLGAEDLERRERASRALRDPAIPDDQVWFQLAIPPKPLGPEARARLLDVARSRIIDAPRGALGIQMAGRMGVGDGGGVTVTGLIPNMPARKVLRPGDRIVVLDGIAVGNSQDLSEIVQLKRPGDRIRVTVMRGERDELGRVRGGPDGRPVEQALELEMDVGSRADLERFGDPAMDVMRVGSRREQLRQALDRAFPAEVRVAQPRWIVGESPDADFHPDVVALREAMSRPDADGPAGLQGAVWRARLERARAMARSPGLSDSERAWFEAAARRLEELLVEAGVITSSPQP